MLRLRILSCQLPYSRQNHLNRLTEATEPDFDVYIFEGEDYETDEEPTSDDVGLNCINQTPLTHLSVIRCAPSQPTEMDDWRKMLPSTRSPKLKTKVVK